MKILIFSLLFSTIVFAKIDKEKIKERYTSLISKDFGFIPHNGTYLIPFSYNGSPNNKIFNDFMDQPEFEERGEFNEKLEAEFQISFLVLGSETIFDSEWDFFIGYTQRSWWQVYNPDWSRPFRETNYAPEAFVRKHMFRNEKGFLSQMFPVVDIGYIHQSNGQLQELSRSWDRIFARTIIDLNMFILRPTFWYRLPEKRSDDDNPDLFKYVGYGKFELIKNFESKKTASLTIIPGTKRAGFEFEYTSPWTRGYRFFLKLGSGTGLSLQDYDHESHKIGIGFILNDYITSSDN